MTPDSGCVSLEILEKRSRLLSAVRTFFAARGFLEVETPIRIPAPANEAFLVAPAAGNAWLRTSPELQMKRLLAAGAKRIFQIGPCFREDERGARHNPEFTMLEWYRAGEGIDALYADVEELCRAVADAVCGSPVAVFNGYALDFSRPFLRFSVEELYVAHAGWNPLETWDGDRFDTDMALSIEPALPKDAACFVTDYPAQAAALARLNPLDVRVAERFEAYLGGMEIANGYGELVDAAEQRRRFEDAACQRREAGLPVYPLDEGFLRDLEIMPPSAGIALGIDRLAMVLCGTASIDAVRGFCPPIGSV